MKNDEPRRSGDGRLYPRLRVRKLPTSYLPWHVEKLYGHGPYATRTVVYEVDTAERANELAGEYLDEAIEAAKKLAAEIRSGRKSRPMTPQEIVRMTKI